MQRADELRERARRRVEFVMTSDEDFSREFLDAVQIEVELLESDACELDELTKKAAT